jgi:hypothetical protein
MGTSAAPADTAAASSAPFEVPKNIAFTLNANVDKLIYDKVEYDNLKGTVAIKDQTVSLKNVAMNALGGNLSLSGYYSTKASKKTPDISLSYDVNALDAEKTFNAFNTVQALMPIGKFISGKINSELTLNGKLGGDMMPLLSSLTGKGNLLLIEGVLKKFAPVEKLAQTLNVNELNGFSLKDIKAYFEFANGKVLVKPFHVKVKDIDMEIGGMHGLDQSIDYAIGLKVPRSLIGSQGNALINNLAQQAASKGIPVKLSDYINLNVKMGGTLTNPQLKTDLQQVAGDAVADMKQQAVAFAQQKIDSAKNKVKDSLNAIKNQAVKDLKEDLAKQLLGGKDSASNGKPLENTKKNAEQTLKNTLNGLLKKKSKDTTKSQ